MNSFSKTQVQKRWCLMLRVERTYNHPDAEAQPRPSVELHHQVDVDEQTHDWEEGQQGNLWGDLWKLMINELGLEKQVPYPLFACWYLRCLLYFTALILHQSLHNKTGLNIKPSSAQTRCGDTLVTLWCHTVREAEKTWWRRNTHYLEGELGLALRLSPHDEGENQTNHQDNTEDGQWPGRPSPLNSDNTEDAHQNTCDGKKARP